MTSIIEENPLKLESVGALQRFKFAKL